MHNITFSVDVSKAGSGDLKAVVKDPKGSEVDLKGTYNEAVNKFSFVPGHQGRYEAVVTFNNHEIEGGFWIVFWLRTNDPAEIMVEFL